MATRQERRCAYRAVVTALSNAAFIDGCMERDSIALAMDALGPVVSDVGPGVLEQAIAFRNGPLLRDIQPVGEYLRKDPGPIVWSFKAEDVLDLNNLRGFLIHRAYHKIREMYSKEMMAAFKDSWCGKVRFSDGYYVVTIYPTLGEAQAREPDPEPERTPEGLLPTILIEFDWVLGWVDCSETVELQIINHAREILHETKHSEYHKLTDSWWAKVECTHIGYLVRFHYSQED